jgi:uncharacterized protein with PIN domain
VVCLKRSVTGTRKQTKQKIQIRRQSIHERVTAVLRSIPNEAFADSFQTLYERCQPCVVKDDDYFEG